LLYNHLRLCLWPFVHLLAWLVFQDHGVLSGPEFILYAAVTTVGFGVCGCSLYFSFWLPCLPHDTLVADIFSASPFLAVFASMISSTSSLRNVSPHGTNSDEVHCMVIHHASYWPPWGTLHSNSCTTESSWGSKSYTLLC
jgi:hypothetical protein